MMHFFQQFIFQIQLRINFTNIAKNTILFLVNLIQKKKNQKPHKHASAIFFFSWTLMNRRKLLCVHLKTHTQKKKSPSILFFNVKLTTGWGRIKLYAPLWATEFCMAAAIICSSTLSSLSWRCNSSVAPMGVLRLAGGGDLNNHPIIRSNWLETDSGIQIIDWIFKKLWCHRKPAA